MILRRVIEHVKKQEWTAIFLDFLIVVSGVFIGIQVSNWNTARNERSLQAAYLERLADGIEADADQLAQLTDAWRREAEIGARTLEFLRDGNLNDRFEWKVLIEIYGNDGWLSFTPHEVAYKELQNTGRLDMIADPQLRTAVGEYYATLQDFARWYDFDTPTRAATRGLVPGPWSRSGLRFQPLLFRKANERRR